MLFHPGAQVAYTHFMDAISQKLQAELERRLAAGPYRSIDELLNNALSALDDARDLLEKELLQGLEGDDVEMTSAEWDAIEAEALKALDTKPSR